MATVIGHKKSSMKKNYYVYIAIIIVAVIVLAIAASYLSGPINISSPKTVAITYRGTAFAIGGNEYVAMLGNYSTGKDAADIYLTKSPSFINSELQISLSVGNTTHVNYNSRYSNMGFSLVSISNGTAKVTIEPLSTSLNILPDSAKIENVSQFSFGSS
ncbi:hypothetical protein M1439_03375 [Candidatus Marsarchaeota archaeon]|jgi:hypothetical protein|nr:hypothetical protein [Candidatus Marsarchaeota archaeon]MCL5092658.1 hypothetical protein [Candidatus Marsarchaeota archaeon]